jgi:hypothetical protein
VRRISAHGGSKLRKPQFLFWRELYFHVILPSSFHRITRLGIYPVDWGGDIATE